MKLLPIAMTLPQPLIPSKNPQVPWSFTPDGKRLAYCQACQVVPATTPRAPIFIRPGGRA